MEVPERQLLRTCNHLVVLSCTWSCLLPWFVVKCCLVSALLLERCRLRCRSITVNIATAPSRTTALSLSSQQAHPPSACARSWAGLTTRRSSWHFDSYRTFQRIRCGQLLLRCQAAHVLNEKLVDTVGDTLVDLAHPILHVVERFLVRNIVDSGGVVCSCLGGARTQGS